MPTHDVGVILIFTGVVGGCWFWFLRNNRRVTRIADELIRGGRFTGKTQQDRPRMIRGMRLAYALAARVCLPISLIGVTILVKSSAG